MGQLTGQKRGTKIYKKAINQFSYAGRDVQTRRHTTTSPCRPQGQVTPSTSRPPRRRNRNADHWARATHGRPFLRRAWPMLATAHYAYTRISAQDQYSRWRARPILATGRKAYTRNGAQHSPRRARPVLATARKTYTREITQGLDLRQCARPTRDGALGLLTIARKTNTRDGEQGLHSRQRARPTPAKSLKA